VADAPAATDTAPLAALVPAAAPVEIITLPDDPAVDAPELNVNDPLIPAEPAPAVFITKLPEDLAVPVPV
jgi:hypothetical protein